MSLEKQLERIANGIETLCEELSKARPENIQEHKCEAPKKEETCSEKISGELDNLSKPEPVTPKKPAARSPRSSKKAKANIVEETSGISFEDMKAKLTIYAGKAGVRSAVDLLAQFKVEKLSDLKENDKPAFMTQLDGLIKAS